MTAKILNLPRQDKYYTKKLKEWKSPGFQPLFGNEEFIPTGEQTTFYEDDPSTTDTCACTARAPGDPLTRVFMRISQWVANHVVPQWRKRIHGRQPDDDLNEVSLPSARLITVLDMLACIVASVMLEVTIVVLVVVRPLRIRLGLILVFGILFALLLKLMAGNPSRGEIFGATAAFYAVAAVFVGSLRNDCASI
jgi:hypothetical protein